MPLRISALVCVSLVAATVTAVAGSTVVGAAVPVGCDALAWDGNDGSTVQIYVTDDRGLGRQPISVEDVGTDPTTNRNPQWSPDGSRVLWTGNDGLTAQVWVADANGLNRAEISSVGGGVDPTGNSGAQWSPDGSRIVWHGFDGGRDEIWVADADGLNRAEISSVGGGVDPTFNFEAQWSPDGSRILWDGLGLADREIWVADADGANRSEISSVGSGVDPTANAGPQWSPDGSRVLWTGGDGVTAQVWVADADGTDRAEVSSESGGVDPIFNATPQWRPRAGDVALSSSASGGAVGESGAVTVTASTVCPHGGVEVSGFAVPCLSGSSVSASHGSVSGSKWTIGALDGTATATITGTVTGACTGQATVVASAPVEAAASKATLALGVDDCESPASPFSDVLASSFAFADVACIFNLGITTGTSPTTYGPSGDVTREQMAAFLGRLWLALGKSCSDAATPFTDVLASSFAFVDVACIFNLGITTGTSPTTYDPGGNVTREQMAAFLARLWHAATNT